MKINESWAVINIWLNVHVCSRSSEQPPQYWAGVSTHVLSVFQFDQLLWTPRRKLRPKLRPQPPSLVTYSSPGWWKLQRQIFLFISLWQGTLPVLRDWPHKWIYSEHQRLVFLNLNWNENFPSSGFLTSLDSGASPCWCQMTSKAWSLLRLKCDRPPSSAPLMWAYTVIL